MSSVTPKNYSEGVILTRSVTRQVRTYNSGWSTWTTSATESYRDGERKTVYGFNTNNYKSLLHQGAFIRSTAYNNVVEKWNTNSGTYNYTTYKAPGYTTPLVQYRWIDTETGSPLVKRNVSGTSAITFTDPVKPDPSNLGDLPSNLVTSAISQIRSEQFDALTQLAELRDLPKLFKSFYTVFQDLYNAFKRGAISKREWKRLFDAPGHWLTYRYGIMPVVLAINDILAMLAAKEASRFFTNRQSASSGDSYVVAQINTHSGDFWNYAKHTVTTDYQLAGVARLYYKDGRPKMASDLMVTTWELVPFSFVIDWVLNVGKILSSRAAISGSSDYDLCQCYLATVKNQFEAASSHSGPAIISDASHSWDVEYIYKARMPSAYAPRLSIDFDMSWRQYADAFALALKLIASIKRH